jgi:hypothetical protein
MSTGALRPARVSRALGALAVATLVALLPSCGTPQASAHQGMYLAKRQWLGSGLWAGSAGQNLALPVAVRDLRMAEAAGAQERARYSAAIADLEVIEHMPAADVVPKLRTRWRTAQLALDRFFQVPLAAPYGRECSRASRTAVAAWDQEPVSASTGVVIGPLKRAVTILEGQSGTNACAAAAMDDLKDLASATRSEIAHSYGPRCNVTALGFEIFYLDAFFFSARLTNPTDCRG